MTVQKARGKWRLEEILRFDFEIPIQPGPRGISRHDICLLHEEEKVRCSVVGAIVGVVVCAREMTAEYADIY